MGETARLDSSIAQLVDANMGFQRYAAAAGASSAERERERTRSGRLRVPAKVVKKNHEARESAQAVEAGKPSGIAGAWCVHRDSMRRVMSLRRSKAGTGPLAKRQMGHCGRLDGGSGMFTDTERAGNSALASPLRNSAQRPRLWISQIGRAHV